MGTNQRKFWTELEKGNAMRSKLIVTMLLTLALLSLSACGRDRNANSDAAATESPPAQPVDSVDAEAPSADESQPASSDGADAAATLPAAVSATMGPPIMPAPLYFIDDASRQIVRLEADGQTTTQLTSEAADITDFDVTLNGERLAFVADNTLIELDLVNGTRMVKVEGDPISGEDSQDRFSRRIHDLHYSPDNSQIAFGLAGVNLVESGSATDIFPLLPSSPYPDQSSSSPQSPDAPIRFFWPKGWSPDGAKILVEFAYFPEAGGLAIFDLTQNLLIDFISDDPAAVACCDAAWYPSSDELALASNFLAYGNPGLSVVDAGSGLITNLVAGLPAEGEAGTTFSFFRAPFVAREGANEGTGDAITVFLNQTDDLSNQMLGYTLSSVTRVSGDDDTTITLLRDDALALEGEVAWLADGSGVAYLKDLKIEGEKPVGSVVWLPVVGEPVDLPVSGQSLHWTAPTIVVPGAQPTPMPQEDEVSADLSAYAAGTWGFDSADGDVANLGIDGVFSFPLETPSDAMPLWASHTLGLRSFETEEYHTVGIFTRGGDNWQELARLELGKEVDANNPEPVPDYLDKGTVTQVHIEPDHTWLQVEGGVGAHSGTFNLLSFDGESLRTEASGFSASPGVASVADLNEDGIQEVILDTTDYYVFCYACGARLAQYDVLRWNRNRMEPVVLKKLPAGSPAELSRLNDLALTQVQGGLWKEAMAAVDEGRQLKLDDPTFEWNGIVIELNAEAKRKAADDPEFGYSILDQIFYGDYEAAVDVMRAYAPDEIFTLDTPLIIGTAAEGSTELLADWITRTATSALSVQPELAPAHYLRGWASYLATQDPELAVRAVALAAAFAHDDPFYQESIAYLFGDDVPTRTPAPTVTPTVTITLTPDPTEPAGTTPAPTEGGTATPAPKPSLAPSIATTVSAPITNILTARTLVNVRSEPSTGARILGNLAEGDTAEVSGQTGTGNGLWLQIVFPADSENRGWISGASTLVDAPSLTNIPTVTVTITAPDPTQIPDAPSAAGSGRIFFSAQDEDGAFTIFRLTEDGAAERVVSQAEQPAIQPGGSRSGFP